MTITIMWIRILVLITIRITTFFLLIKDNYIKTYNSNNNINTVNDNNNENIKK